MPKLLKTKSVCDVKDCDRTTLHRHVKKGLLPAPIKIAGRNHWRACDVYAAIRRAAAQTRKDLKVERRRRQQVERDVSAMLGDES